MSDERGGLSSREVAEFARLPRTMQVGSEEEERTVRRLRMEGLIGQGRELQAKGEGRERGEGRIRGEDGGRRLVRLGLALAAGLACYVAGLWSERSGIFAHRSSAPRDTLAMATQIIRF